MARWVVGAVAVLLVVYVIADWDGIMRESAPNQFRELSRDVVPGEKFAIDLLFDGDGEPSVEQLQQQSDAIAAEHPGYARHFVGFYLDGMPAGDGYYATAHRTDGQLDNVIVMGR